MKQILVTDDSIIVRQLLSLYLMKYLRCEVTEARDGVEAMEKLGRERFDLVITDLNMPRMHGLSLVKSIRDKFGPSLPIVVVTTKGGEEDRDRALQLGADGYVTKPVKATGLIGIVAGLLSGSGGDRQAGTAGPKEGS